MRKTTIIKGKRTVALNFHATKPFITRPVITGTHTVKGEKYYRGEDGKLYRMDLFDAMFKVDKTTIMPDSYKGEPIEMLNKNEDCL